MRLLIGNVVTVDNLVSLLLNERQSRSNKNFIMFGESAMVASSFRRDRSGTPPRPSDPPKKEDKPEKQKRCRYCQKIGHTIEECTKRIASEKMKKLFF